VVRMVFRRACARIGRLPKVFTGIYRTNGGAWVNSRDNEWHIMQHDRLDPAPRAAYFRYKRYGKQNAADVVVKQ
jgi:hypothetical protein